jgi:hypothetical protein
LPLFAVQFHPEVAHTPRGSEIISTFLFDICGPTGPPATSSRARWRRSSARSVRPPG